MGIPSRRSPGNPLPLASASFVVVGLTNGPGWYPNPCLADHVARAKARGLWTSAYSMTTFPTAAQLRTYGGSGPWVATTRAARLRNAGYAQAVFNVGSMQTAGLDVPFVWVDVEPYPTHPWSRSVLANRQVVRGVVRAYEDAGFRVGFYSYDGGWRAVVGGWRKPAYPAWVPVGPVTRGLSKATARCAAELLRGTGAAVAVGAGRPGPRRDLRAADRARAAAAPADRTVRHVVGAGCLGPAVATLQRGLNMRPSHVTGRFDAQTRRVVRAFQLSRAFPITGVATDLELRARRRQHPAGTPNRIPATSRRTDAAPAPNRDRSYRSGGLWCLHASRTGAKMRRRHSRWRQVVPNSG